MPVLQVFPEKPNKGLCSSVTATKNFMAICVLFTHNKKTQNYTTRFTKMSHEILKG